MSTSIEWTNKTWNPVLGCSMARGSETGGCLNCYAARMAMRNLWPGEAYARMTKSGPRWTGKVELRPERLDAPLRWKPSRVFVNSMSNLFHEALPDETIDRVFAVMAWARHHTYQILTKRPTRMQDYSAGLASLSPRERTRRLGESSSGFPVSLENCGELEWPFPWVWLGVSVEDQATADERTPLLLQTPAAVRFVSYEPALGPVDLRPWLPFTDPTYPQGLLGTGDPKDNLAWVIVGGESGPGARPFDIAWARSVVRQCREAGVACFVKQMGAKPFDSSAVHLPVDAMLIRDPKGGDPAEWPEDLRVREFPA